MERALPCVLFLLLLFLLGGTAGESGGGTCRLGPYGELLPDDPLQCPGRLDGSGESSSEAAPASPEGPGEARAGDPPAKETGRSWPLISGVSAEEVSRSPAAPKDPGIFLMKGDPCHKWVPGQASPVETFRCPTQPNHQKDSFCCGTCTASYCCSFLKDRLDQARCFEVMEEAEESTWPSGQMLASISRIASVLLVSGVMCLCAWISCICIEIQKRRLVCNEQRAGNEQQEELHELFPEDVIDRPSSSQGPEEYPGTSERPPAVASPPDGSGSPMVEMAVLPAVPPEGNLELPAEEEETAV